MYPLNFSTWITVTTIMLMLLLMNILVSPSLISTTSLMFDLELISFNLSTSNMNSLFFKLVSTIALMIFIWSLYYMTTHKSTFFYFSLLSFVLSMLLLTMSNSMLSVFLGWEGLGITSFALIVFYQNWMSAKGGLLTLLTNRLGDAILIVTLCGFMTTIGGELNMNSAMFLTTIFMILTLTKSAQWPFVSWLPAAMAAPTPVSSLVHSSTLVTAGVWLMIRFSSNTSLNIFMWGILGMLTLAVASLSALLETDAKKIVALSTLSQLGLMFIALSLGTPLICFFHILMHALAKANLFMIIGGLLHSSFSQQDARLISSSTLGSFMILSMGISLFSLMGITFTSGFYSKEQILMSQTFLMNSTASNLLLIMVASLTLAYCLKLFMSVSTLNPESVFYSSNFSLTQFSPIFFMSTMTIFSGLLFSFNLTPCSLMMKSTESLYWTISILGILCLMISTMWMFNCFIGFYSQLKMIDISIKSLKETKTMTSSLESSSSEMTFLLSSFILMSFMKQGIRLMLLFSLLSIILILL